MCPSAKDLSGQRFGRLLAIEPPTNTCASRHSNGDFVYNGIDRLDNALGYTLDNCVPCCKRCNQAKNNMGLKEFRAWLVRAYKHTIETGGNKCK